MYKNTRQAYRAGFENRDPDATQYFASRTYAGQRAARQHAQAWRESLRDHADTSYYGVQAIRVYRAFWLGVARGIRERDGIAWFSHDSVVPPYSRHEGRA